MMFFYSDVIVSCKNVKDLISNMIFTFPAISNYVMAAVGITPYVYRISLKGRGINKEEGDLDSLPLVVKSAFPSTMQRLHLNGLAFAVQTSTLVTCGGNQVSPFVVATFLDHKLC